MELREEGFYNDLDDILAKVHMQCTKLNSETTKENVKILEKTIDEVKELMRKDDLFNTMFNKIEYVGSYYEKLRVKEADEFDVNVVMVLPLDYSRIVVEKVDTKPGLVKVKIDEAFDPKRVKPCSLKVKDWMDQDGYLSQDLVYQWMWSVAARASGGTNEFQIAVDGMQPFKACMRKSGPAITLTIENKDLGKKIDVDIVFALQFPGTIRPPISGEIDGTSPWAVVPKTNQQWRLTFYNNERRILDGKNHLKHVLRLLKSLRDAKKSNLYLPSYYIKTLFLLKVEKENSIEFWKKRIGYLFMTMLLEWHEALLKKQLPFYWQKETNLLTDYKTIDLQNKSCLLKKIIMQINKRIESKDKEHLRSYLFDLFAIPKTCEENELSNIETKKIINKSKVTVSPTKIVKCEESELSNIEKKTTSTLNGSPTKTVTEYHSETVRNAGFGSIITRLFSTSAPVETRADTEQENTRVEQSKNNEQKRKDKRRIIEEQENKVDIQSIQKQQENMIKSINAVLAQQKEIKEEISTIKLKLDEFLKAFSLAKPMNE